MGRRTSRSIPVSFFSFQDIVTSVTGILILVTLMLAVDIISPIPSETISQHAPIGDLQSLQSQLSVISSDIEQKKNQLQSLLQVMAALGKSSSANKTTELKELSDKLSALKQLLQIRQTQLAVEVNQLHASKKQLEQIMNEHATVEAQNREADQQLIQKSKISTVKLLPGPSAKKPIIIECKGNNAIFGSLSSQGDLSVIGSVNAHQLKAKIAQICRPFNPEKEYFVIYVHSDATNLGRKLIEYFRESDFDVGWDLLADHQNIYEEDRK